MLKPRFRNKAELLSEFKASLEYMDKDMPKDKTLIKREEPKATSVVESAPVSAQKSPVLAEAAPLSKYSSPVAAVNSFRVLAGLEERELSPWNPGILGETRTVKKLREDFGMPLQEFDRNAPYGLKSPESHSYNKDLGGYSEKAAHKALRRSDRVLSNAHMYHTTMGHLPDHARSHIMGALAKHSQHAAYKLRGAADGAPPEVHAKLHALADRHEKHARIYGKGSRPKLEAIEEMISLVESLLED